jgi:hypothetical protein
MYGFHCSPCRSVLHRARYSNIFEQSARMGPSGLTLECSCAPNVGVTRGPRFNVQRLPCSSLNPPPSIYPDLTCIENGVQVAGRVAFMAYLNWRSSLQGLASNRTTKVPGPLRLFRIRLQHTGERVTACAGKDRRTVLDCLWMY